MRFEVDGVPAAIANPVPVITAIFALPAELNVIFPLAIGMFTLLLPLLIFELALVTIPVN